MLNRDFLEKYPLYRKFPMQVPSDLMQVPAPAFHMLCETCASEQTFNPSAPHPASRYVGLGGSVYGIAYRCSACNNVSRYFLLKFNAANNYVMKVGQEPPWEIAPDRELERVLGARATYYKRGLICESQGYGIGAFAYYRRIVEEIIDELLQGINDLIDEQDREQYSEALKQVAATKATERKIDLVKDLLPSILRPDGMNPLDSLHDVLSEGLHAETDERCLELAETVREVLVFMVNQIAITRISQKNFTTSMRKLLDRQKK